MPAEKFANRFATTLSAAVADTTGTSISVANAAPTALQGGQFRIRVGDELMLVTATGAAGASPWTVTRGVEGSTATTHASGVPVTHVLTAESAKAVGIIATKRSGRWYSSQPQGIADSTASQPEGQLHACPLVFDEPDVLDRIEITVGTAASAGGLFRLGLYLDTGDAFPGALLLDAGTVATDTAGDKEIIISQAVPAGVLWLAGVPQGAPATLAIVRRLSTINGMGSPIVGNSGAGLGFSNANGYLTSGQAGALPDPFPVGAGGATLTANVKVRIA